MNTRLEDLKQWPKVYDLVLRNVRAGGASIVSDVTDETQLSMAFNWSYCVDKLDRKFWLKLATHSTMEEAKEMYPELFEEDFKRGVKAKMLGLWK